MQQDYRIIQEVSKRQVIEHFLRLEVSRPRYADRRLEIETWLHLGDLDLFERVRRFGAERDDTNPLLTWTVGTKNNQQHTAVRRWVLAEVQLDVLYVCGLNPSMKADLHSVNWNLSRLADLAHKYPEFRLNTVPDGEARRVVGIAHRVQGKDGVVELVDGAHRVVAMAHHDVATVHAYIGELV